MPSRMLVATGEKSADRIDRWTDHWRKHVGIEVVSAAADFHGVVEATSLAQFRICSIRVGQHTIARTRKLIDADGQDLLKLVFQRGGETCVAQHDDRVVLRPGEWMVYDTALPYRLLNTAETDQLALLLPRNAVSGLAVWSSRFAMRAFPTKGVSRLLMDYLGSTLSALDTEIPSVEIDLAAVLGEILKIALDEITNQRSLVSMQETMRERIRTHIRRNASDPDLGPASIAQALGCTKRYLHKVFNIEESLCDYIWHTRLERCRDQLTQPLNAGRSVTDIAFSNGFSNSAHFCRVFKRRYGMPPSTFRQTMVSNH